MTRTLILTRKKRKRKERKGEAIPGDPETDENNTGPVSAENEIMEGEMPVPTPIETKNIDIIKNPHSAPVAPQLASSVPVPPPQDENLFDDAPDV